MNSNHILDNLSTHLKNTIARAIAMATALGHTQVSILHLLSGLLEQQGAVGCDILQKVGVTKEDVDAYLTRIDRTPPKRQEQTTTALLPELDTKSRTALEKAMVLAYEQGHTYVGTEHLLHGIMNIQDATLTALLKKANTTKKHILDHVQVSIQSTSKFPGIDDVQEFMEELQEIQGEDGGSPAATPRNQKQKRAYKALDVFATKLTDATVQKGIDPVVGREKEIERLIHILSRRSKNNPVLVGEPGVGKTAIVEGLAKRIIEGDVPDNLKRKNIYALDLAMLISGTIYRGEFEARIKQVIEEVSALPDAILFIDEVHNIIGAGSNQGTMDAANILKPALARGKLRCIGATTLDEYTKYISNDPALERRFQSILIKEPSREETIEMLTGIRKYYEEYHSVRIPASLISLIVDTSMLYIHDNYLPDKAIDILDEAAAKVRMRQPMDADTKKTYTLKDTIEEIQKEKEDAIIKEEFDKAKSLKQKEEKLQHQVAALQKKKNKKQTTHPLVTKQDIAETISARIGMDANELQSDQWEQLELLKERLNRRIFGQPQVVEDIIQALQHARLHRTTSGPYTSLLFVGPSGVGKTALAKYLAQELYHNEQALIKFDMSEFAEGHSVSKLLGSPAGYIGHKERNRFTEQLKKRPHSVVLFDEIDKAHPDVVKLLLQILDEGELTDSAGKKISFHHAIIIMTSNIGEEFYRSSGLGFTQESAQINNRKKAIEQKLVETFSRPLIGRMQKITLFESLSNAAIETIVKHHIDNMNQSLKKTDNMEIRYTKQILAQLAKKAYNKDSGARYISSTLSQLLDDELIRILRLKRKKPQYTLLENDGQFYLQ